MLTRFREPVNGFTHLAGAVLAIIGLIWLISMTHDQPTKMLSLIVYGVSLTLIYVSSATFHLAKGSERTLLWLRRLDHAAIHVGIAGAYTPFCYNLLTSDSRWIMLGLIWALAVGGVVYKLCFLQSGGATSILFYLAMGWLGLVLLPSGLALLPIEAVALLLGGGVVYTVGAIIFGLGKPNLHPQFGHHELWHLFVLSGSALHFIVIARYIA
jgi:hemolysin III